MLVTCEMFEKLIHNISQEWRIGCCAGEYKLPAISLLVIIRLVIYLVDDGEERLIIGNEETAVIWQW